MPHPHDWQPCALCERDVPPALITLHHLTPKSRGGKAEDRVPLCKPCHKQLHATFTNKQLDASLDSVAALREAAALQPFLKWIRKQRGDRNFRTTLANSHPHKARRRRR